MKKLALAAVGFPLFTGCASITGDTVQSIRVETFATSGDEVKGAQCKLENENGGFSVTTPGTVMVRRSSKDMSVTCQAAGQPDAKGTMVSRANAGMFGNIIFGGGIGAVIDHSKGTAYTYPQWIKMVFGKMLGFDRSDDRDGQPSVGRGADQAEQAQVAPAAPSVEQPSVAAATATTNR